ncbi:MAG: PilZ domain-containing protein [Rhizobiales bacterium]|nr:PilZ domain-containing protein [Hyphomicrobiales bacterium]
MFGRYMLPDMTEHPCQVTNLTVDGAIFMTDQAPLGGQQVVAYIDDIGRVEAITADRVPGGFRVLFSLSGARRDRFISRLAWLAGRKAKTAESRRHARYEPKDASSSITLPDGRVYPCEVMDISLSGAAIKVDIVPSLGTHILLGKMRGRVVRYHPTGIAIEFLRALDQAQLTDQVA